MAAQDDIDQFYADILKKAAPPAAGSSGGAGPPAAGSPPPAAQPDDEVDKFYQRIQQQAQKTQSQTSSQSAQSPQAQPQADPSVWAKIGAGLLQGAHNALDYPAETLARASDYVGLTPLLERTGLKPSASDTIADDRNQLAGYNKTYGNSTIANTAKVIGDVGATTAELAAGGRILGPVVRSVVGAPVTDFLAGQSGNNLLTRGASVATNGAIQGAAGGALSTGGDSPDQPLLDRVEHGAAAGAVLGPVVGAVGGVAGKILGSTVNADPQIAALAKTAADKYGINLTGPQIVGGPLKEVYDQSGRLIGSGAQAAYEQQASQLARAVGREAGMDTDRFTPQVMSANADRLKQVFDNTAANAKLDGSSNSPLINRLAQIEQQSKQLGLSDAEQGAIQRQIDTIVKTSADNNGVIPGSAYQTWTNKGGVLDQLASRKNTALGDSAQQIRGALDDALEAGAKPEDLAAYRTARGQYRAMMTLDDIIDGPTSKLNLAKLPQAVTASARRNDGSTSGPAYTGGGNLGELANISQLIKPPATPQGSILSNALTYAGIPGGEYALLGQHPLIGVGHALVAGGANRLAQGYMRTQGFANRIINPASQNLLAIPGALAGGGAPELERNPLTSDGHWMRRSP